MSMCMAGFGEAWVVSVCSARTLVLSRVYDGLLVLMLTKGESSSTFECPYTTQAKSSSSVIALQLQHSEAILNSDSVRMMCVKLADGTEFFSR